MAGGTPGRTREGLPLAPNEERYVLSEATSPEIYGNPWTTRIRGQLDVERFEAVLTATCQRHEALRAGFEPHPDGRYTRYVEATAKPPITRLSLPSASDDEIAEAINAWYFHKNDLTPAMLTRFILIRTGPSEHVFGYTVHHTVCDGESKDTFIAEVFERYSGRDDFPPAPQFSDLWGHDWTQSDAYLTARDFWIDKLQGGEDIGRWPEDGAPGSGTLGEATVTVRIPPEVTGPARRAAEQIGVSEFTFYYAVTLVALARLTGQARVASTFQSGGRRGVPGAEGVIGCFSNSLILATAVDEAESISALASRLRGDIRAALAHEAFPYHHVIRATGVAPAFGVNWFPKLPVVSAPGLEISRPDMAYGRYEYDINMRFIRDETDGGIDYVLFHREGVFGRDRVRACGEHMIRLLEAFARDVEAPIGDVESRTLAPPDLLPDPAAAVIGGGGELIHARMLDHAARNPQAIAILHEGQRFTYADLEVRSRGLARAMAARGVRAGDRVAILAERGPQLVWSMLAALRLGAVFTVLDSAYPEARLESHLEISGARALVTAGDGAVGEIASRLAQSRGLEVFEADEDGAGSPDPAGLDAGDPDQPAYFLFTSGSTGQPKCVACSHRPLSHFVEWQARAYGLTLSDRFTLLSGLSHDPMLRDVFTPLSLGAALLIPRQSTITEPGTLRAWMRKVSATVAHMTPPLGGLLLAGSRRAQLPKLRRLFWGGDQLSPVLVKSLATVAPRCRQVNFYGATETPQAVGVFDCDKDLTRASIPIGRGSEGSQLLVADAQGRPVGPGEVGEITVRSAYPNLGYVQGGAILPSAERETDGYRTGDRGLYLPGGAILMLGRADDQVKVRGHRVELAEVTSALLSHPKVQQATTLTMGEGQHLRIVAFAVSRSGRKATGELEAFLAARLPAYMLPRAVHLVAALPLTANGKVDRKALTSLAETLDAKSVAPSAPASATERALIAAWAGVLGEIGISRDSTFVALGGDSLSYVQAFLATEEVIGVVPPRWQFAPISELAQTVRARNRLWSEVDLTVLVRALSIFLIVSGHFGLIHYGGGAVSAMMLVSGFMFGGLQLVDVFAKQDPTPILRTIRNVFAPALLMTLLIVAMRWAEGVYEPYVLTFTADFQTNTANPVIGVMTRANFDMDWQRWQGHEMYLWYVHCLIHMMLALYLAMLGVKVFGGFRFGVRRVLLGLFALACVGRFGLPALIVPGFFDHGAPPLSVVNYLPTTHLPTLLLGGLIAASKTWRQKLQVLPILAVYAALTAWLLSPPQAMFLFAAGLVLMTVTRLRLPRVLTPVVFGLSGASLFIYMGQYVAHDVVKQLVPLHPPLIIVAAALGGGVLLWLGWVRGLSLAARQLRRPMPVEIDATV